MKNGASVQECQSNSTEYVVQKPCMGSNVMVSLSKEEPTAFNFAVEDIRAMKLLADGGMLISFTDGSTLTITNFQEAKASFPFTDISMNDGTVMNLQKVAAGLASTLPHDSVADLTIMKPQGGIGATDLAFVLQEGKTYTLGFDLADVSSVEQKGGDLLITFKDGSHLTLQNYEVVGAGVLPPQMTLADGSVIPAAHLINVLNVAAAEQVKLVEPAAGDVTDAKPAVVIEKQPQVAAKEVPPEALAEIEPAAGAAGPIGGTGGGYGFNSSVDAAGIVGLNAIGPIGPTQLQFDAPEPEDFGAAPNPTTNAINPPTLNAVDRTTLEDTTVNLQISANGGDNAGQETLTITVSGIPAGWGVDLGLSGGGTFNAGTGTYTITLPQGSSYAGGPYLIPPHDSDVDIRLPHNPALTITLTTTDVNNGTTETITKPMNVIVDAVADQPTLTVSNVVLPDGVATHLPLTAAVTDTDGSEILTTATLTGIPAGFVLTGGGATYNAGTNTWTVDANQLSNLQLTSPAGYNGEFIVTVHVNNQDWTQAGKDEETTLSNNTNFNEKTFKVTVQDTAPIVGDSVATVDDTSLVGGPNVVNGNVTVDFNIDTPGTFGPAAANTFTSTGFKTGGTLSSNGFPVTVTLTGNTYTGTANGVTVFTMVVNSNGTYTFTQFEQLDHSDTNNPNEAIQLNFTVTGTDSDGDTDNGTITINVLDDAPIANDDQIATGNTVNGSVTSNDTFSQDVPNVVTQVVYNGQTFIVPQNGTNVVIAGQFGTLTINNTGAYTYASNNVGQGTDNFTYTLRDGDGDTDTAVLAATINDVDSVPVIGNSAVTVDDTNLSGGANIIAGQVPADYLVDGPGSIAPAPANTFTAGGSLLNGALSSGGNPVTVTLNGNTYTGTANGQTIFTLVVNANGQYTFTQFEQLDHGNPNNPNEGLTLNFTVVGTDNDGDTDTGVITVTVLDDAPVAIADNFTSNTQTVSGDITTNDQYSQDTIPTGDANHVYDVFFGGETRLVPQDGTTTTITNAAGTLTIDMNGVFTYTPPVPGGGTTFKYRLVDFDGDKSAADAANGTTVTVDTDDVPVIGDSTVTVDETNLSNGAQVANGTFSINFGGDGQGGGGVTVGSYTGPALTSGGNAVTVTKNGNTFTGTANGVTIFTMVVNPAAGTYTFTQFEQLDHPNPNNPNEPLNLTFSTSITDADGDTDTGVITAVVLDDAPIAVADSFSSNGATVSGNITTNDNFSEDTFTVGAGNHVYDVVFGGQTVLVAQDGSNTTITNAAGTLVINMNGQFTYTPPQPGMDTVFRYRLIDFDGDLSAADAANGTTVTLTTDAQPIIGDSQINTDETSLISGPVATQGTVTGDFFGDGPGTISLLAGFSSGGSKLGGNLTSNGVAVTTTLNGNTYTGTANGVTVFTLTVQANGQYTFTQFEQLDHADGTNPNDAITLNFNVRGTDADGDTDDGTITVTVFDDAPAAQDDIINMPANQNVASGNVRANDLLGQDAPVPVTSVVFNGQTFNVPQDGTNISIIGAHGTLTINNTGAYTYTSANTTTGTDTFRYTIRDFDGDPSSANLSITIADLDTVPVIGDSAVTVDETNLSGGPNIASGTVSSNYFNDGPGSIAPLNQFTAGGSLAGGTLKSHGVAVNVALNGNTYTGTANGVTIFTLLVNANGTYTFTQYEQLDHADASNPNDVITLSFAVRGTDADGDTDTGTITVNVLDDAPIAVNDSFLSNTATATGNILTNDNPGQDTPARVNDVTFGGESRTLPADGTNVTITNAAGTLTINTNGVFTYTPPLPGQGTTFTYHIVDFDGDLSQAVDAGRNGTVTVDTDGTPTITTTTVSIDEDGPHTVTGTSVANFFGDGPGTFLICQGNTMTAGGSLMNGVLSSHGVAVTTTLNGNTYTGTANGQTVFTMTLLANGSYTFTQFLPLDHADGTNPNDVITLAFQICAQDADGDVGHGTVVINVVDSAPVANNDAVVYCTNDFFHNGNLMLGFNPGSGTGTVDQTSYDSPTTLYAISSANGGTQTINQNGATVIDGAYGKLFVFSNGAYAYYAEVAGDHTENFTYWLKDFDGDTEAATLTITAQTNAPHNSSIITANGGVTNGNDGANAIIAYAPNVSDTIFAGGGDDVVMTWSGNDQIHGGAGNDTIFGEHGSDTLWGDSGADVFVGFRQDMNGGVYDTIMDFNKAEGDVIDLTALIDNGSAAQAAINSYVRSVNSGGGSMLQVNNNDGSGWHDAVFVNGQSNLNVQDLLNTGNLDVN